MFGKESKEISEEILVKNKEYYIRILMLREIRFLNLSNSVSIVLLPRQQDFSELEKFENLHRLHWSE
ncbi:MAG: hypothetical protein MRZ16_02565 [Parvimonas sp.]|uniref:hypothetical protein n=1 Tax=Parvimonas sp. TaxID=1944660 RepID=UPI0025EFE6B0|nr:hypothetical protein [Parvimonas sp.]MCI5997103.1 hypothetical protein [Parvimonas sp.]